MVTNRHATGRVLAALSGPWLAILAITIAPDAASAQKADFVINTSSYPDQTGWGYSWAGEFEISGIVADFGVTDGWVDPFWDNDATLELWGMNGTATIYFPSLERLGGGNSRKAATTDDPYRERKVSYTGEWYVEPGSTTGVYSVLEGAWGTGKINAIVGSPCDWGCIYPQDANLKGFLPSP